MKESLYWDKNANSASDLSYAITIYVQIIVCHKNEQRVEGQ